MVNSIKNQLEEAKESEETLKSYLTKKEEIMPHAGIGSHQPQEDSTRKQGRNQKIEDWSC
jgi:cell fate (sporulation/competence/biofilm development) regulator YlbF (YheA/YmcA/DUF963 family)